MKISQLGLQAFLKTAQEKNMTKAAKLLGVTQSALSQRIALLEDDLETTLFFRENKNLILTESGEGLLSYAKNLESIEDEFLESFQKGSDEVKGEIRIAGFSSVMRSVVLPAIRPILKKYPQLKIDLQVHEMMELPEILKSQKADIVLLDYHWRKKGIASIEVGVEEYVEIKSSKHEVAANLYLDHGPHDNITLSFFHEHGKSIAKIERNYFNDVYGIIDAVESGFGKAIMSKHLIVDNSKIKVNKSLSSLKRPVVIHYYENSFYPKIFKLIETALIENAGKYL